MGKEIKEINNVILRITQSVVVHAPNYAKFGGYDGERDIYTMDIATALYKEGYHKQSEGHWFILEYEYFTCSECGYYHPNGCDSTREAKEKLAEGIVPKYCSECGAKMKGV